MYLKHIKIRNIRSIKQYEIEFDPSEYAGWHVLLGDNGSGKSTLIRSMALGLTGPSEAAALRQNWRDWLRLGQSEGVIELHIDHDSNYDKTTNKGRPVEKYLIPAALKLKR